MNADGDQGNLICPVISWILHWHWRPVPCFSSTPLAGSSDEFANARLRRIISRLVLLNYGSYARTHCADIPVLTLREFSPLGIVGEAGPAQHFFPWTEVVEISASPEIAAGEELALAVFADSEP